MLRFLKGEVEIEYIDSMPLEIINKRPKNAGKRSYSSEFQEPYDVSEKLEKMVVEVSIEHKFRNHTTVPFVTHENGYKESKKADKLKHPSISASDVVCMPPNLSQLGALRAQKAAENNFPSLQDDLNDNGKIYFEEIIIYLWKREREFLINPDFLLRSHYSIKTRATLNDWLIKVQMYLGMSTDSLHLGITLADNYLSRKALDANKYQLLGITTLYIAGKVMARSVPPPMKFCYLTDGSCSSKQLLKMEMEVLTTLEFQIYQPIPHNFNGRNFQACVDVGNIKLIESFVLYILDLMLIDNSSALVMASQRAAAAIMLARSLFHPHLDVWTDVLEHYTGYSQLDLKPCVEKYVKCLRDLPKIQWKAAYQKFSSKRYHNIAVLTKLDGCQFLSSN